MCFELDFHKVGGTHKRPMLKIMDKIEAAEAEISLLLVSRMGQASKPLYPTFPIMQLDRVNISASGATQVFSHELRTPRDISDLPRGENHSICFRLFTHLPNCVLDLTKIKSSGSLIVIT